MNQEEFNQVAVERFREAVTVGPLDLEWANEQLMHAEQYAEETHQFKRPGAYTRLTQFDIENFAMAPYQAEGLAGIADAMATVAPIVMNFLDLEIGDLAGSSVAFRGLLEAEEKSRGGGEADQFIAMSIVCPKCKGVLHMVPDLETGNFKTYTHVCGQSIRIQTKGLRWKAKAQDATQAAKG